MKRPSNRKTRRLPWPIELLSHVFPVPFLYHSVTFPFDLHHEVSQETKLVREHRRREKHRYGRLLVVRDSTSTHASNAPRSNDRIDLKGQARGSARAGELFNQLPLEVVLAIFQLAGLSHKEIGQLLTVCKRWYDFLRHPDLWRSIYITEVVPLLYIPLLYKGQKRHGSKVVRLKGLVHDIVKPSYEIAAPPTDYVNIIRRPLEYAGDSLTKASISCYNVEIMSNILDLISSRSKVVSDLSLCLLRTPSRNDIPRSHYLSMGRLAPWRTSLKALHVDDLILRRSRQTDFVYFDLSFLENLETLTRSGSVYDRHYPTGSLPVGIKRLRGRLLMGVVQPDDRRLLEVEQLDISYQDPNLWYDWHAQECLHRLLEKSSPIGSLGESVVSEISLDLMNMGMLLPIIALRCPALRVLRFHFRRSRQNPVDESVDLPDVTGYGNRMEHLMDQCSALERIELPVGGKATWYQAILAAPWVRRCQTQDIEIWCCGEDPTVSGYRLC